MKTLFEWLGAAVFLLFHLVMAVIGLVVSLVATALVLIVILAPFVWLARWLFG